MPKEHNSWVSPKQFQQRHETPMDFLENSFNLYFKVRLRIKEKRTA